MARVLGVDYGTVRIGLAITDPDGVLAQPFAVIPREGAEDEIAFHVRAMDVVEIVVGLPIKLNATHGPEVIEAEAFAMTLESRTGVPVSRFDERLSTVEAERAMRAAGTKAKDQRGVVDKIAAALVLQAFLDARRTL